MVTYMKVLVGTEKELTRTDITRNLLELPSSEIINVCRDMFANLFILLVTAYIAYLAIYDTINNLFLIIAKVASDKMLEAAHKLILCGKSQGILRDNVRVIGARQVGSTASPGFELYEQIQNWPEWVSSP